MNNMTHGDVPSVYVRSRLVFAIFQEVAQPNRQSRSAVASSDWYKEIITALPGHVHPDRIIVPGQPSFTDGIEFRAITVQSHCYSALPTAAAREMKIEPRYWTTHVESADCENTVSGFLVRYARCDLAVG